MFVTVYMCVCMCVSACYAMSPCVHFLQLWEKSFEDFPFVSSGHLHNEWVNYESEESVLQVSSVYVRIHVNFVRVHVLQYIGVLSCKRVN